MAKPFDPILKVLAEASPPDWVRLCLGRHARATLFPTDLSTLGGSVDTVLRVAARVAWLLHLEFQTGHDGAKLPRRLLLYNAVLELKHEMLVRSVAVLLRPEADSPELTGIHVCRFEDEPEPHIVFRYAALRVWQLDPEVLLRGGEGLVPLAPISNVRPADLPGVVERMKRRLRGVRRERELWAATYILMGLRHSPDPAEHLLRGVMTMKESSTYQAILAEGNAAGAVAEARKLIRLMGSSRFGDPDRRVSAALDRISDLETLEALSVRLLRAATWHDLLELPPPPRRRKADT
jgi:predicted transposase YdaD